MIRPGRTPLHIQLADIIRSQIESGVFSAGDQLPTEMELMRQHELSSSTVRQAVLALVGEGLLYRRAGKGTFVAKRHIGRDLLTFSGFSEEAVARGFRPGTRHVTVDWRSADAALAAALNVPTDENVLTIDPLSPRFLSNNLVCRSPEPGRRYGQASRVQNWQKHSTCRAALLCCKSTVPPSTRPIRLFTFRPRPTGPIATFIPAGSSARAPRSLSHAN
ncbi:MAG: GntR family transcriptional regulator [Mesorhizobium sp.]|nr:GntR family transcriptional regulator [Mesorhizobium sp. M4A.F.Ca.ET.020.02.1.1]RWC10813.1 MAG: GntR family transcriptional regulator [Mesorhizobium sp.]RWC26002.1 MAG: GntR family transcriptional regulator [Mesorhizobium sp.]RWC51604.1 MAG: GntR family transcriptional regulator [Mesorhizobium sp.]RWD40302.1 MAG: GntR family transcriptional regulator [Mesorhizobium sp.]